MCIKVTSTIFAQRSWKHHHAAYGNVSLCQYYSQLFCPSYLTVGNTIFPAANMLSLLPYSLQQKVCTDNIWSTPMEIKSVMPSLLSKIVNVEDSISYLEYKVSYETISPNHEKRYSFSALMRLPNNNNKTEKHCWQHQRLQSASKVSGGEKEERNVQALFQILRIETKYWILQKSHQLLVIKMYKYRRII